MSEIVVRPFLAGATVAGLIVAVGLLSRPAVTEGLPQGTQAAPRMPVKDRAASLADGLVRRAMERPAFRADRTPASSRYDAARAGDVPAETAPPEPRPLLRVTGLVLGAVPTAVVEGAPGIEGSVVLRRGDTVAGLRVLEIREGRVVIRGRDTTWRLGVRQPQQ